MGFWRKVGSGMLRAARHKAVRRTGIILGCVLGAILASALAFHAACHGPGAPAPRSDLPGRAQLQAAYPDYKRTEESTYLTLPEWYEVFSYQEYASAIAAGKPSGFR